MSFSPTHLVAMVALLFSVSAMAANTQTGSSATQLKQSVENAKSACAPDIKKYCSDVTPGEGRLIECLNSKEDKLSQSCQSSRLKLNSQASKIIDKTTVAFRKDCGSDVQKFCADVPSGQGRLLDCLDQNHDKLSTSCKDFGTKVSKTVDEFWKSQS